MSLNQLNAPPSSSRTFQRYQRHDLKHPGLVDLIVTKQNKLPCFIDRSLLESQELIQKFNESINMTTMPKGLGSIILHLSLLGEALKLAPKIFKHLEMNLE
jgi:hypothetical protein